MNKSFDLIAKKIIDKKIRCLFISPHLDDAILSCGGLIFYLNERKVPVTIMNVFSEGATKPYTLSARVHLYLTNHKSAKDLYRERRKEDKFVLGKLGLKSINLGFIEALYRKRKVGRVRLILGRILPEIIHVYRTYHFGILSGDISKEKLLEEKISGKLRTQIGGHKNTLIFCPLGLGVHVDHILVRQACSNNFEKLIYWYDFPYKDKKAETENFTNVHRLEKYLFDKNIKEKKGLISGYQSQIRTLFKKGIKLNSEKYFVNSKVILNERKQKKT